MEDTNSGGFKSGVIALIGPPNAGKSTFLNKVMGEKVAIVSRKPQTTRNQITGILTRDGVQAVFLDTPGIHNLRGRLNRFLLDSAWSALWSADIVALVLDASLYCKKPNVFHSDVKRIVQKLNEIRKPFYVVANKVDKIKDKKTLLPFLELCSKTWPQSAAFPLSAVKGQGVEDLVSRLLASLPEGEALYPEDQLSTLPLRFMASEVIREKLFDRLSQEIPYQTAVEIENWEEEENGLVRIAAVIYVSKDNYKGMVVGKQGKNLKEIGRSARLEMEEMIGQKVFLQLWVKVKKRWTENPAFLNYLGLGM